MGSIRSFEDLDCWKKAREIKKSVSTLIKTFPSNEKYSLVDQVRRSSKSVTANIAEGYGRFHFKENMQYCRVSRGSLYETKDYLITAFDEGYIDEPTLKNYKIQIDECLAVLNGYINYLNKNIEQK